MTSTIQRNSITLYLIITAIIVYKNDKNTLFANR